MSVLVPHFNFPLALVGSTFGVCEQDSPQDLQNCVLALLTTPVGSREVLPTYGAPEILFSQSPIDAAEIIEAIALWEPRAIVKLDEIIDAINERMVTITPLITPSGEIA